MWDETLIESMGARYNSKRWLTIQIAAIVHAAVVGILAVGSFWYVDKMSLPAAARIEPIFYEIMPGGPPPPQGIPRPPRNETPQVVKPALTPVDSSPSQIVPEDNNNTPSNIDDVSDGNGDLPTGVPWGVPNGDPNSTAQNGFGGQGGNGPATTQPVEHTYYPSEVDLPVIIDQIKPEYPEPLRRIRREGTVVLEAVITRTGSVKDVTILQSAHPLFDQSAIQAVRQWRYSPATLKGKPVAVFFTVTVRFTLR